MSLVSAATELCELWCVAFLPPKPAGVHAHQHRASCNCAGRCAFPPPAIARCLSLPTAESLTLRPAGWLGGHAAARGTRRGAEHIPTGSKPVCAYSQQRTRLFNFRSLELPSGPTTPLVSTKFPYGRRSPLHCTTAKQVRCCGAQGRVVPEPRGRWRTCWVPSARAAM